MFKKTFMTKTQLRALCKGFEQFGTKCIDINECADETDPCAAYRYYCVNTVGSFECKYYR